MLSLSLPLPGCLSVVYEVSLSSSDAEFLCAKWAFPSLNQNSIIQLLELPIPSSTMSQNIALHPFRVAPSLMYTYEPLPKQSLSIDVDGVGRCAVCSSYAGETPSVLGKRTAAVCAS